MIDLVVDLLKIANVLVHLVVDLSALSSLLIVSQNRGVDSVLSDILQLVYLSDTELREFTEAVRTALVSLELESSSNICAVSQR